METQSKTMLSKSASRVQAVLIDHGIDTDVVELPASTRTALEAAQAIGCQVAQIVKSLIFRTTETNRAILALTSGTNRVNEKLIAQSVGERITKADAAFTREVTGFAIGGIPPIGHKTQLETYIDKDLLLHQDVWAAAGTPHAVFRLASKQLERLTSGKVIVVT